MSTTKKNNRSAIYLSYSYSKVLLTVICLVCLGFVACKKNNAINANKENEITFDTIYSNKAYHINNDSTQPSCNLKLTFIYPKVYSDKAILDSLQRIFISSFIGEAYQYDNPTDALAKYEKDYIEDYKHDIEIFYGNTDREHDSQEKYLSYYETITNKIDFNRSNLLSFEVSRTNYKGGANTYKYYNNYSINLITGDILTENDIFKPEYTEVLSSLFKENIMRENKVKNLSDLNNLGYFGVEEIVPNGNFLIEQNGITYTFNTGEYSAYRLDPIVITIPFDELKSVLKEDLPISQLIEN